MVKQLLIVLGIIMPTALAAVEAPITGSVQSKCSIYTDIAGVYSQPLPNKLTTDPLEGGVLPKIRYDVVQGDYYKAKITWPNNFTSSPALSDAVNWDGEVVVAEVTDVTMSDYETNKIEYNNVTEFDLTVSGTVWFTVSSSATYGYDKSFPAGTYTSVAVAECIAK